MKLFEFYLCFLGTWSVVVEKLPWLAFEHMRREVFRPFAPVPKDWRESEGRLSGVLVEIAWIVC
jgi:hypothetical protein